MNIMIGEAVIMDLKQSYYEIYGKNENTDLRYKQLLNIIQYAKEKRPSWLTKQDKLGNNWYLSEKMVGMMLYVDRFCKDLYDIENKIDYLVELGITYVHFMPLLQSREGNNDGGYARLFECRASFRKYGTTSKSCKIVKTKGNTHMY